MTAAMGAARPRWLPWAIAACAVVILVAGLVLGRPPYDKKIFLSIPFVAVGVLLAYHRSGNPIGWLFLAFGVVAAIDFTAYQYARHALVSDPGSLPGGDVAASVAAHITHPSFGLLVFSFLLFPDGRLLSPRWRWAAAVTVVTYSGLVLSGIFEADAERQSIPFAKPLFHGTLASVASTSFGLLLFVNLVLLATAGVALLLRLKRSRGEQRQQLKVFVYGVAFVMFVFPISVLIFGSGRVGAFLFPLIPVSAGVAILKYRLYDIDVVINRALVYGALTATLAGVYLGSVLLLQLALSGLTKGSGLAVAASTLGVAALFRPARARIQGAVDRRFFRRKYDAQQTLEAFSLRLRDEIDLRALNSELSAVVRETLQPAARVALAARDGDGAMSSLVTLPGRHSRRKEHR